MNEAQREAIRADLADLFESVTLEPLQPDDITIHTYRAWHRGRHGRDVSGKFALRKLEELVRAGDLVELDKKRTDAQSGQGVRVWQKVGGGSREPGE